MLYPNVLVELMNSRSGSVSTLEHYLRHGFFWMPERVKKAVAEVLRQR